MVDVLAELADLHIKVREATSLICTTHPSPICRAISNRVKTFHLRSFVDKVVDVEASILNHDAAYVGAYKIVPLSTIVSDFQPWARPLRWLWKTIEPLRHGCADRRPSCSGATALRSLYSETRTGYTDIKTISEDLLVVAQRAWIHSLMPWILYGKLPHFGRDDFMIQARGSDTDCILKRELTPYFVVPETAETILAVGLALQQITPGAGVVGQRNSGVTSTCSSLMPDSLHRMGLLQYPLQHTEVSNAVTSINDTISQSALSIILPTSTILELLLVLQEYILLRNGEFSTSLIQQTEKHLASRQAGSTTTKPVRKLGRLDDLNIHEAETASILEKTWSDLLAFIPEKESESQVRQRAAEILRLAKPRTPSTVSTLLPNAASLTIQISPSSPLGIFISTADIQTYETLGAYLISMRRAEFQLTKLWREPSYRRCYPTPLGPPRSATRRGQQSLAIRRRREDRRNVSMRQHWATVGQILFLISELSYYFHGEVILKSWEHLSAWLDIDTSTQYESSRAPSRPTTSSSKRQHTSKPFSESSCDIPKEPAHRKKDPRSIARAHRKYLESLTHNLLLNNKAYTSLLSDLLLATDHYVALFNRLQIIWKGLDLQDQSAANAFSNYTQEETELASEMKRTKDHVTDTIHDLVGVIHDIERQRDSPDLSTGVLELELDVSAAGAGARFRPWRAKTLDRLLMKLDSLAAGGGNGGEKYEDALVELDGD